MSAVSTVLQLLGAIWHTITQALTFQPEVFTATIAGQNQAALISTAIIAGASLLIGQSAVLFINQVTPARLVLTITLSSIATVAGWALWAVLIWLVARTAFQISAALDVTIRLVTLASAPFVFGFLILTPYFGTFFGQVLHVWSLLLLLSALIVAWGVGFWQACLCATLGWLVLQFLNATVGRLLTPLRAWLWQLVTGTSYHFSSADDLVTLFFPTTDEASGTAQQ